MKRYLYSLLLVLVGCNSVFSQTTTPPAPLKFNYQAVARNQDGSFMANLNNISVGISIHDGEFGPSVYSETHNNVSTNRYGLFNLQIGGKGTMTVDWSTGAKWIAITINNNPIGKAELLSVPYALYANSSGTSSTSTSNSILNGDVPPSSTTQGKVGDFYIDNISKTIYGPKLTTGWPTTGTKLGGNTFNIGRRINAGSGIAIDTIKDREVTITNTGLKDSTKYIRKDDTYTSTKSHLTGTGESPQIKDNVIGLNNLIKPTLLPSNTIILWDGNNWTLQTVNLYTGKGGVNVSKNNVITVNPDTSSIDTVGGKLKVRKVSGTIISDSIALAKLEKDGATNGQVLKYDALTKSWEPDDDLQGSSGTLPTMKDGQIITNQTVGPVSSNIAVYPTGDVSMDNTGKFTITDASITKSKLAANAVDSTNISSIGLSNIKTIAKEGQVLKYKNNNWVAADTSTGTSQWSNNPKGIDYTNSTKPYVGIGTNDPLTDLHIKGANKSSILLDGNQPRLYFKNSTPLPNTTKTVVGLDFYENTFRVFKEPGIRQSGGSPLFAVDTNAGVTFYDSLYVRKFQGTTERMVTVRPNGTLRFKDLPTGGAAPEFDNTTIDTIGGKIGVVPNSLDTNHIKFKGDNKVLVTSNGKVTWVDKSTLGAAGFWTPTSGGINYVGKVGINNSTPTQELDVIGTVLADTIDGAKIVKSTFVQGGNITSLDAITGERYTVNDSLVSLGLINTPTLRISGGNPTSGQVLSAADNKGNVKWTTIAGATPYTAGTGVRNLTGNAINVANDSAIWNANKILGRTIDTTQITQTINKTSAFLKYDKGLKRFVLDTLKTSSLSSAWNLTGNAGTDPTKNFIGTLDDQPLVFKTNNIEHLKINGSTNPNYTMELTSEDEFTYGSIGVKNYGDSPANIDLIHVKGKIGTPSPITSFDNLGTLRFLGYNGAGDKVGAQITAFAAENWTTGVNGTGLQLNVTEKGKTNTIPAITAHPNGNVGIGSKFDMNTPPVEQLEVNGAIRIWTTNTANPFPGTIRYEINSKVFQGHNGTQWVTFGGGTGSPSLVGKSGVWVSGSNILANPGATTTATIDTTTGILRVKANSLDSSYIVDGKIGYSDLTNADAELDEVLTYTTTGWKPRTAIGAGWNLTGNSMILEDSTDAAGQFLGSTNNFPLIFKTVGKERMRISRAGNVNIDKNLNVGGLLTSSNITEKSDARYKTNVATIGNALATVQQLRGVSYDWKRKDFPEMNFKQGKDLGLIAQEVEKVLPELVNTDENGFKSVQYSHLVSVLVEAIKEQQKQIETLKAEVSDKDNKVQNSENRIKTLEASVSTLSTQMQLLLELVGKNEGVKAESAR